MTALPEVRNAVTAPRARAGTTEALGHPAGPGTLDRPRALRLGDAWLSRAAWTVSRTGRPGLVGIALLLAAAVFLLSTHLRVASEVKTLRAEVVEAQHRAREAAAAEVADPAPTARALPARTEVPAILGQLFEKAAQERLAVDTAKYEIDAAKSAGVVRYRIAFPIVGPYPRIRAFIDKTLATMPTVALQDLALERKSIGEGDVEAQIRMTVYTRSAP